MLANVVLSLTLTRCKLLNLTPMEQRTNAGMMALPIYPPTKIESMPCAVEALKWSVLGKVCQPTATLPREVTFG